MLTFTDSISSIPSHTIGAITTKIQKNYEKKTRVYYRTYSTNLNLRRAQNKISCSKPTLFRANILTSITSCHNVYLKKVTFTFPRETIISPLITKLANSNSQKMARPPHTNADLPDWTHGEFPGKEGVVNALSKFKVIIISRSFFLQ